MADIPLHDDGPFKVSAANGRGWPRFTVHCTIYNKRQACAIARYINAALDRRAAMETASSDEPTPRAIRAKVRLLSAGTPPKRK